MSSVKKIDTVPEDIYRLLSRDKSYIPVGAATLGADIQNHVNRAMESSGSSRELKKLWATDIGKECHRATWLGHHHWREKAPLPGHTSFKFLYGNVLEELALHLAREAGHSVEEAQTRIEAPFSHGWKVSGKIDGILDGVLMDVKSTSPYGFSDYSNGVTQANDKFGYRYQLAFYYYYGPDHWRKTDPKFLFVDKQNGHICIANVDLPSKKDLINRVEEKIFYLENAEALPNRAFVDVPEGAKGNMKLPTNCSYCDFKKKCWPEMRTFLYSKGPVFLTKVVVAPNVTEVTE